MLSYKSTTVAVYMTHLVALHVSWHSTFRGIPCIVSFHISWYFTPRINQDSHGKFLNFTREYLCVMMRGLPRMCEVIVELYHIRID